MHLILFDDCKYSNFLPLTYTRSFGDLRCGILKFRQRLESTFGKSDSTSLYLNDYLTNLYTERHPDWIINQAENVLSLIINTRLILNNDTIAKINALQHNQALYNGNELVACVVNQPGDLLSHGDYTTGLPNNIKKIQIEGALYQNIAEIIHDNARMISWDFDNFFYDQDNFFETELGVTVLHPYNVWIGDDVTLNPGVILDATQGPIVLDEGVKIMHNAVLCGPLYIGKKSIVKIGAKIYGSTSIGPTCKVGGEIEGSIIQAYTNKQHDGFLGHAYIGEWVNIGADTNNSDLKNTYKNVAYYSYTTGKKELSSTPFLGCVIGDHSKIGINCSINTGAVIGVGCNIWSSDLITDFIPDFSWGEAKQLTSYKFDAFCETASLVKQRRQKSLSETEIELLRQVNDGDLSARLHRS